MSAAPSDLDPSSTVARRVAALTALSVSFLSYGCAGRVDGAAPAAVRPGLAYVVTMDADLTDDQVAAVNAALGQWETATPGLAFRVYAGPATGDPHTIHFQNDPARVDARADGCMAWTTQDLTNDSAIVHLDSTKPQAQWTAAHEIGHAMGLQHDPESGTLMCADEACSVPAVTPADVAALFSRTPS
jgi:hypothetical protein